MKIALVEERVKELAVQVHPHVLSHLNSEFREDIDELEENYDKRLVFEYARDLVLGQTRFFYVNERGVRVLYDMDQRINSFAGSAGAKSKANVPLPLATTGGASPQTGPAAVDADGRKRRRRRGGRRQREREQQRLDRDQRIRDQAGKAVTFGDKLPDAPKIEVIREEVSSDKPKSTNARGRRRKGSRRAQDKVHSSVKGTEQPKKEPAAQPKVSSAKETAAPEPEKVEAGGQATGVVETLVEGESDMAKKAAKKKTAKKKPAKKKPAKKKPAKKTAAKRKPAKKKAAAKKKPAKKKTAAKKKPAKKKAAKRKPAKRKTRSSSDE
jgi:hypothetical protein